MATTWIKALHRSGGSIAAALDRSTDYIKDGDKTNDGELLYGYECDPYTAQSEFLFSKRLYEQKTGRDQGKHDVIAYHIRMSFKPSEVTAEQALELGRELAFRWTKNKHQFIVASHTNTNNPHVHIIYNSVNLDCTGKYQDFKRSAIVLRRLSDQICLENGLSNTLIDARNLIETDNNYTSATPILSRSAERITKIFSATRDKIIITQGFIASYTTDSFIKTTTLGRGGSDYTASIIGASVNASEIQI